MDRILSAIADAGLAARCFTAREVEAIAKAKGAYLLLIRLDRPQEVRLRKSGSVRLAPGWVVYCGSAGGPGGLRARLRRHFRDDKTPHWHVDQLTTAAAGIAALPVRGGDECDLVARLLQCPAFDVAMSGFGNSDCARCGTHLLRFLG